MDIEIKRTCDTAHLVRLPLEERVDWSQHMLLMSDLHADNPHADLKLITKTLDQARERNARVYLFGDTFCAMQGKYDHRSDKSDLRPEHQVTGYLDALVSWMADILGPYADLIDVIGYGNHETSILKKHETDLIERLVGVLNDRHGTHIQAGSYAGYVVWRFSSPNRLVRSHTHHYDHGAGGGGPVTRGAITSNRVNVYIPDADSISMGHIHERMSVDITKERLDRRGRVYLQDVPFLRMSTAKEERLQKKGYHVQGGRPPKPLGWWWLEFTYDTGAKLLRMREQKTDNWIGDVYR